MDVIELPIDARYAQRVVRYRGTILRGEYFFTQSHEAAPT